MPFFDFHIHPTLKSMFSQAASKTSPWSPIDIKAIHWVVRWCTDFEYILCSQGNMKQLIEVGCNLVCVAIFTPERGMTRDKMLNKQAKGTLSRYLDPIQLNLINDEATQPVKLAIEDINEVLLNNNRFGVHDRKVVLLKKGVSYNPSDPSTLFVAFSIEGCHSISNSFDRTKMTASEVINNLRDLVDNRGYPIISVNLTHLEQYPICNHAFGILFVSSDDFKPGGKEIDPQGIEVIKECYRRKILIDLKHMSLGARRFFIEKLRTGAEFAEINQPLVCTHAGFTGLSFKDIPDYLDYRDIRGKPYGYILWNKPKIYGSHTMTAFNPSSINLYNEEILAILVSGGLIGLSLDKRILGFSEAGNRPDAMNETAFEEEYISDAEKKYFLTKRITGEKMNEDFCITSQEILEGGEVNPDAAFYHLCHFMSHILHLIRVASDNNYDVNTALKQVCIGSDFDGMINPIWCCPTIESMPAFKSEFIKQFPFYATANAGIVNLPPAFDIHEFAANLFFENGKNFLMRRLALIHQA